MANPIPLTDPSGTVYGYLCGICLNSSMSGSAPGRRMDITGEDKHILAKRRKEAERCCSCEMCGEVMSQPSLYTRCNACEQPFRHRLRKWMDSQGEPASARPGEPASQRECKNGASSK